MHPLFSSIFAHSIDETYWRKLLCAIVKILSCASLICALFSLILLTQSIGANCCAPFLKFYPLYPFFRFILAHSIDAIYCRKLLCAIFKTLSCASLHFCIIFAHSIDRIYCSKLLCAILKTLSCASLICALFSLILLTQSIGANCCAPFLKLYPLYPFFRFILAHSIDAIYCRKLLCAIFKTLSQASLHSSHYFRSFYWRNLLQQTVVRQI